MNLVITGPSGVGKTTVFRWLKREGVPLPIVELDNFLPQEPRTRNWRLKSYENFVTSKRGNAMGAILVGQVPVAEFLSYTEHLTNPSTTFFLYLALSEEVRRKRLEDRGWSEESIEGHRNWHIRAGLDAESISPELPTVDCTGKSVDEIGREVLEWIVTKMQEHSGSTDMEFEPTVRNDSHKRWVEELPTAKSLDEIRSIIMSSPADEHFAMYHPLPFARLHKLKTAVGRAEFTRKAKLIRDSIELIRLDKRATASEIKVIDIGANSGGVAFDLASCGYDVTAVEPDARYYALGKAVARVSGTRVYWRHASLGSALQQDEHFHLGLALSVFQWAARGGKNIENAGRELRHVSEHCEYMLFEQGFNAGHSCFRTDDSDHYRALVHMLLTHTCYTNFRMLPTTELYPGQVRYLVLCWGRR
jgi:broad-specificity NMP kinase/SAM-dependent methyltransferase